MSPSCPMRDRSRTVTRPEAPRGAAAPGLRSAGSEERATGATREAAASKRPERSEAIQHSSESGGLGVVAPLVAEGPADLAECGLGPYGVEHGGDHVVGAAGRLDHPGE